MSTLSTHWFFWALLSALFAALTAVFAKLGLAGIDADLATLLRTAIVLALLAIFVVASGKWSDPRQLEPRALLFLALSAVATGASWLCYFRALAVGDAALVSAVDKSSVVLVAILAVALLGERPSAREWMGITLVGAGVLLIGWRR